MLQPSLNVIEVYSLEQLQATETPLPYSHCISKPTITSTAPPPSPHLHSTVAEIRSSLSLLEVELVDLKESIYTHSTTKNDISSNKDQINQIRNQQKGSVKRRHRKHKTGEKSTEKQTGKHERQNNQRLGRNETETEKTDYKP